MSSIIAARKDAPYYRQLDGLRALAVMAVIVEHMTPIEHWAHRLPWGVLGVQMFFVLSGFLITGILLRCRSDTDPGNTTTGHSLWVFYGRRFLRIFPLYYLTLAILFLCDFPRVRETILWHVCYLSNILLGFPHVELGHLTHFWTLGVEEQFYLCWPLVMLLVPRRALLLVTLGTIAVAPLYRLGMALLAPSLVSATLWTPFANLDSLGLGALLALSGQPGWADFRKRAIAWSSRVGGPLLVVLLMLCAGGLGHGRLVIVTLGTAFSAFFFWMVARTADGFPGAMGRILTFGPLAHLGKISYGIYVIHNFVPDLLTWLATQTGLPLAVEPGLLAIPVCLAVSVVLASLSWYLFEAPLNALKVYFPYRTARPQTVPACALALPEPTSEVYVSARS
jgi:peptidoglycan/LPS O-acetylase OafA/YrhL